MSRVSRGAVVGSAGLLAVSVLSGCGGSTDSKDNKDTANSEKTPATTKTGSPAAEKSPAQVVRATNGATAEAGSARVQMRVTAKAGGESVNASGKGVVDLEDGTSRMTLDLAGESLEQRIVDQVLYQRPPKGAGLPGGKSWTKIDLEKFRTGGGDSSQINDPASAFAYSAAVSEDDVDTVGKERIGGVETTHYRVGLDLAKLAKGDAEQEKQLRRSLGDTVPVDLWIDAKGLTRRQAIALTVKAPQESGASASPQKATVNMVIDMTDFGVDVAVDTPPATETLDITDKALKQTGADDKTV